MKEYYLHTNKKNELDFSAIYEVENCKAKRLFIDEKAIGYKIIHYLKSFNKRDAIDILDGENLLTAIYKRDEIYKKYKSLRKYDKTLKLINEPGEFYSRIYRPIISSKKLFLSEEKIEKVIQNISGRYDLSIPRNEEIMIASINQLAILTDELNLIFKTLHPTKDNYKSYGHNIRNLLILVCTEVEAQLKGIIKSNSSHLKTNYKTSDYYKLNDILKLAEYKVAFSYYPSIELCSPFKSWKNNKPTQSLKWYDSYNAVKHDREGSFDRANLRDTIDAVSALAILIIAQYGNKISYWNERIGNYYSLEKLPSWNILDHYLPPFENCNWEVKTIII